MAKLIGYARVSTRNQSTDRQEADLLAAGIRRDDLYIDHGVSGARASRPQFDRALAALHDGDTLVITTLDRLGRSTQNMLTFADELRTTPPSNCSCAHVTKTPPLEQAARQRPFFDQHAVEVSSVETLLRGLFTISSKHHQHHLVWRGQQNASWPVESSLSRKLRADGTPSESRLIDAEMRALSLAQTWGHPVPNALEFLAELQHYGAPTRLLDATVDAEMAAWFAVEANPDLDEKDGRIIAWGRRARTRARTFSTHSAELRSTGAVPFWHTWANDEERSRLDWGTGSRTWSWFPPALSDRMRAQRAGFLIEASPLVTPTVAEVVSEGMNEDWRAAEISRATSIVGLPSRIDARTHPNDANLVPIFSLRVRSSAKAEIRDYLESRGLSSSTVYPDLGGLVNSLRAL